MRPGSRTENPINTAIQGNRVSQTGSHWSKWSWWVAAEAGLLLVLGVFFLFV